MGVRNRTLALIAAIVILAVALIFWGTALTHRSTAAEPAPPFPSPGAWAVPETSQPLDLEKAADQAENLSEDVYSGLATTQKIIGKTPARNEAIEHGRDKASATLQDLAQRARQAETAGAQLSETDRQTLEHISE
ncbi:MAG: hypothetical protein ACFCVD_16620 [Nodosilinea sp.]